MTLRHYLRPTAFVDAPFGHDGKVARLAGGMLWFGAVERVTFAVVDLPLGAIRRHLVAGRPLPRGLRAQLEAAVRAALRPEGDAR